MNERRKPNPNQPDRCPSIDPYGAVQCGRLIHDDDGCILGGIGWVKGSPAMGVSQPDRVRVAISMRRDDHEELKRLAEDDAETVAGYLRKALATHRYIRERVLRGAKIIVEEAGTQREVIFQ